MPVPLAASNIPPQTYNQQAQNGGGGFHVKPAPVVNIKRKSSKPIINWFQRKLAGTVRARRGTGVDNGVGIPPLPQKATSMKELTSTRYHRSREVDENGFSLHQELRRGISNEISLNGDGLGGGDGAGDDGGDDLSTRKSSVAAASIWSRSNPREADDDASLRPLPPTSPPSPSPSRSSSSYLSDPRTFKSMSTSTKPTTVMSIDLTTGTTGMAHIAQAPPTPSTTGHAGPFINTHINTHASPGPANRFPPHIRTSSTGPGTSITFSALPPSPQSSSRPSSLNPARSGSLSGAPGAAAGGGAGTLAIQAPQHTSHHPRNNPRPSSPPLDNASMLTLASSAFAVPATRTYQWAGGDSVSHLGGGDSMSHFVVDDALQAEDRDASVRALRPRSSRRGSWDSEASGWSAAVSGMGFAGRGERSVRTAPSFRTGGLTLDDHDGNGSLLDVDGTSLRADMEDQEEDEGEKENRSEREGSDDEETPLDTADEHEEVSTPGMSTKPLHFHGPDLTPKKEKIAILGAADEMPSPRA